MWWFIDLNQFFGDFDWNQFGTIDFDYTEYDEVIALASQF